MAEIDEFYVDPERRSLRIGAGLLNEASQALEHAGIAQLQLQLGDQNMGGKRFYEAHGFRPVPGYALWQKSLIP